MAQITYEDKVALYENEEIADINKCNASDMNEIKNAVNDNYNMIQNLKQVARTGNYNDLTNRPVVAYQLPNTTTAQWIKLGTVKLTGQTQQAIIKLYDGDGQNARTDQNMSIEILIKRGYQSSPSTSNIAGVSYQINKFVAKNNVEDIKVKVMCTDTSANLDVYIYFPWGYSWGYYTVSGNYISYTHSGTAVGTSEPSTGTTQPCDGTINGNLTGTTNGWTWIKIGNMCACWKYLSVSVPANGFMAWGGVYSRDNVFTSQQYPFAFKSEPLSSITPYRNDGAEPNFWTFTCTKPDNLKTHSPCFGIARGNTWTVATTVRAIIFAVGII